MNEQIVIPNFPTPRPSPAAGIVRPVAQEQSPFPEGWDSIQAVQLGGADPKIPIRPDLYARWGSSDPTRYRQWLQNGFVKVEKSYLKPGVKFEYWDEKDQAYRYGDLIAICCPWKDWMKYWKGNHISANARVQNRFSNFKNQRRLTATGELVADNYIPELKWDGPKAVFPEDEK